VSSDDEENHYGKEEEEDNLLGSEETRLKINELIMDGIEEYQKNMKKSVDINFFFVSENEVQFSDKRVTVNLLNNELQCIYGLM
jgi:hypothetical protein